MTENIPKICIRVLMLPSAIGRSHLTRLVLIALELERQGAEVAFAFKENNQILEHYQFQVFPVSDAVVTDFSSNVFAAYTPSLIEQCVKDELYQFRLHRNDILKEPQECNEDKSCLNASS